MDRIKYVKKRQILSILNEYEDKEDINFVFIWDCDINDIVSKLNDIFGQNESYKDILKNNIHWISDERGCNHSGMIMESNFDNIADEIIELINELPNRNNRS